MHYLHLFVLSYVWLVFWREVNACLLRVIVKVTLRQTFLRPNRSFLANRSKANQPFLMFSI